MSHRPPAAKTPEGEAQRPAAKKVWERPRILSREPLEGVAVVCSGATAKSDPGFCSIGPITS